MNAIDDCGYDERGRLNDEDEVERSGGGCWKKG